MGPTPEDSHQHESFNSDTFEGSVQETENGSQWFHQKIQGLFERHLRKRGSFCTVSDIGPLVDDALKLLERNETCRPRAMTRKDLFPLPVQGCHSLSGPKGSFLQALLRGLNSLSGTPSIETVEKPSPVTTSVVKRLGQIVELSGLLDQEFSGTCFQNFFSTKGLDYAGEEIRLAQRVTWASIEPSLPPQVGTLDIRDFCEGGVPHFVNHIDDTIIQEADQVMGKTPSVMVEDEHWAELATNLVSTGLCKVVPESSLYHVGSKPLLNGLFSVGKDEIRNGVEVGRLIMNLKPWNSISRSLSGDIGTLPMITGMGSLYLHEDEVLCTSSEDLRCFFYLFKVPPSWEKFMAFGRIAPRQLVPDGARDDVLPMGYLNSVGIAQHIHRCIIKRAVGSFRDLGYDLHELRRDRLFSSGPNMFRIYLDNFDQLQKVDKKLATLLAGTPSHLVEQVREYYASHGLPRHPKKSVEQALEAEVQGAWLDGRKGTLQAKPVKVCRYIELALEALRRGNACQRELQVIAGGFVYASMFRRPLLSSLNLVWRVIVGLDMGSAYRRVWLSRELMLELFRYTALLPLAFTNFRSEFDPEVTASDASTSGGGVCVSRGLSPFGMAASLCQVRGDVPEEMDLCPVLSIGMFDGIGALRVALDLLGAPVCGHISIEKSPEAQRVVEANFPDSLWVDDVEKVDEQMVQQWALTFGSVGVVVVGAGPPCQGVSGLNCDRKGALKDLRSRLFIHVPRVFKLVRRCFPWAQVHSLTENVASMDGPDCEVMNHEFELQPWYIDSHLMSLCHRPRLYWITWEVQEGPGVEIFWGSDGKLPVQGQIDLIAEISDKAFLEPGWEKVSPKPFPTFTTSKRRPAPDTSSHHTNSKKSTACKIVKGRYDLPALRNGK